MIRTSVFLKALITGTAIAFVMVIVGLSWIFSNSALGLLGGGVNTLPQGTMFVPKQAPGMVSLLTNPEKLYGWRGVTLPLSGRHRDRVEWQNWETNLLNKVGFNYQRDWQPWLGEEITFALTSLDTDNNPRNGAQPGYLIAAQTKNNALADTSVRNFYRNKYGDQDRDQDQISTEEYKGAKIISPLSTARDLTVWSSAVVGNFVLFANQPQIIRAAINQAQAVDLNLNYSDEYRLAMSKLPKPHVGVAYIDVLSTSAWIDKSATKPGVRDILSASFALKSSGLLAQTILAQTDRAIAPSSVKSFLDNPQLRQIVAALPFDDSNAAYIDLQQTSLLEEKIPLYKVSKLAIKSLFPHLKAIAIKKLAPQEDISRTEIMLKLDQPS